NREARRADLLDADARWIGERRGADKPKRTRAPILLRTCGGAGRPHGPCHTDSSRGAANVPLLPSGGPMASPDQVAEYGTWHTPDGSPQSIARAAQKHLYDRDQIPRQKIRLPVSRNREEGGHDARNLTSSEFSFELRLDCRRRVIRSQ